MLTTYEKMAVVIIGLLIAVGANLVMEMLDMPDVHMSNTTGECVKVLNYAEGDRYSCDNLPKRYNHVWVL